MQPVCCQPHLLVSVPDHFIAHWGKKSLFLRQIPFSCQNQKSDHVHLHEMSHDNAVWTHCTHNVIVYYGYHGVHANTWASISGGQYSEYVTAVLQMMCIVIVCCNFPSDQGTKQYVLLCIHWETVKDLLSSNSISVCIIMSSQNCHMQWVHKLCHYVLSGSALVYWQPRDGHSYRWCPSGLLIHLYRILFTSWFNHNIWTHFY